MTSIAGEEILRETQKTRRRRVETDGACVSEDKSTISWDRTAIRPCTSSRSEVRGRADRQRLSSDKHKQDFLLREEQETKITVVTMAITVNGKRTGSYRELFYSIWALYTNKCFLSKIRTINTRLVSCPRIDMQAGADWDWPTNLLVVGDHLSYSHPKPTIIISILQKITTDNFRMAIESYNIAK